MKIRTHSEARKRLTPAQQEKIVNWYADTILEIEHVPINEINYYLEELE